MPQTYHKTLPVLAPAGHSGSWLDRLRSILHQTVEALFVRHPGPVDQSTSQVAGPTLVQISVPTTSPDRREENATPETRLTSPGDTPAHTPPPVEQPVKLEDIDVRVAGPEHEVYAEEITEMIAAAAAKRGTGIARRSPSYIGMKLREGKAIIAMYRGRPVGFCYIESWSHGKFVANSGLIVDEAFRNSGLARRIKKETFRLSRVKFPDAKIFSITTSLAVMKLNSDLGYRPVTFSELTDDPEFWKGCQSCRNYDILERNSQKMCLCTGMLYDPQHPANFNFNRKSPILERLRSLKRSLFLKKGKENQEGK